MEPSEIWLLEVFTAGVLAILLGLAGLGGWWLSPRGVRDVVERRRVGGSAATGDEDGRVDRAGAREPEGPRGEDPSGAEDFRPAWWLVTVGALLLGIYFGGWVLTG